MEDLENKLSQTTINLHEIYTSLHKVLNTFDVRFNIQQFLNIIITKILVLPVKDEYWDGIYELFDSALLGCVTYDSDNNLYWARWVYNKLIWRKKIDKSESEPDTIDYIKEIEQIGKTNKTARALYAMRLLFVTNSYESEADIIKERTQLQKTLILLNSTIDDWIDDILLEPLFYNPIFSKIAAYNLTYHNCNNAFILYEHGRLYSRMLNKLYKNHGGIYRLPKNLPIKNSNSRKKIGFVSQYLFQHSVGKVSVGIIEQLYKRNEFEIHIFANIPRNDPYSQILVGNCHKYHQFSKEGQLDWIQKIQSENIDILIFLDPIMDITMYILACFRIVPIQIATSGHPESSGLLSIDYFVSSRVFEKCNDVNYVEELVLFDSLNMYYYSPNKFLNFNIYDMLKQCNKSTIRQFFNFPDCHIYAISCPCLKISPQFEKIIHKILLDDPNGILIMTEDINSFYFKKIINRFNKNMSSDICNRIYTIPFINNQEIFYKFIYSADIILDPYPFGGLISTIDIFSCSRSIITLPGEKLYGRFTSGAYNYMGLSDINKNCLIAENVNDYVKKAIELASNKVLRESIEDEIKTYLPRLFEDTKTIDDWTRFLHSLE